MESIGAVIRQVARKRGTAKPLSREQAAEVMGAILDGHVSDIEMGALCVAMRLKGETAEELLGFLDAVHARVHRVRSTDGRPVIVIPSYNGARRLPVLTPLLALLLARQGHAVLVHGSATETVRVTSEVVFAGLGISPSMPHATIAAGTVHVVQTQALCPGLKRLIDIRLRTGLRNSGHSLVKLMNPVNGAACLLASYTHGEYAEAMSNVVVAMQATGLLMHGVEGEPIVDGRRIAETEAFIGGRTLPIAELIDLSQTVEALPTGNIDAESTVTLIRSVLEGREPVPMAMQQEINAVDTLLRMA
ncbi:MAG: DNA-binding protein YbiB [Burkholderiaceae bacterium]|nr:DNA-binding protein YbiB [Burkholderiaceae bacterium]